MKNILTAVALSMLAASAFAQGLPVSASAVAQDDVSARSASTDPKDNRRPGPEVAASVIALDCCGVSNPVSAPQVVAAEEDSGALSMAGLGFGLAGLVGVSKLARRKKADKM